MIHILSLSLEIVLLCIPGRLGTHYVDQASLELTEFTLSLSVSARTKHLWYCVCPVSQCHFIKQILYYMKV